MLVAALMAVETVVAQTTSLVVGPDAREDFGLHRDDVCLQHLQWYMRPGRRWRG